MTIAVSVLLVQKVKLKMPTRINQIGWGQWVVIRFRLINIKS